MLRKLIEQKFSIIVDDDQFESLLDFLNQREELNKQNGQIHWNELFKKLAEIESENIKYSKKRFILFLSLLFLFSSPWKYFKESFERSKSRRSLSSKSRSTILTARTRPLNTKRKEDLIEEEENNDRVDSRLSDSDFSSDDEEIKFLSNSADDEGANAFKKYFNKEPKGTVSSDMTKTFKSETKVIKVRNILTKNIRKILKINFYSVTKEIGEENRIFVQAKIP